MMVGNVYTCILVVLTYTCHRILVQRIHTVRIENEDDSLSSSKRKSECALPCSSEHPFELGALHEF